MILIMFRNKIACSFKFRKFWKFLIVYRPIIERYIYLFKDTTTNQWDFDMGPELLSNYKNVGKHIFFWILFIFIRTREAMDI